MNQHLEQMVRMTLPLAIFLTVNGLGIQIVQKAIAQTAPEPTPTVPAPRPTPGSTPIPPTPT
ncbi:MAG: hypothetical protein HC827_13040, partial [Cyanobacteria bacterium RM1_2_2]|nr:hypothetical protein [Cyanobacteria bacterium RM1_2_2]